MRTNKMILAIVLLLAMLTLAACSGNSELKLPIRETEAPETTESDTADVPTEAASEDEETEPTSETAEATDVPTDEVTVETTLLYDVDGVKVSVTGLEENWLGYELKFLIENDSDKDVLVTTDSVSVNGYMQSYYSLYCEVAAGKKANDEITLYDSDMEKAGIDTVAEVQFYVQVSEQESWDLAHTSELITVQTSAAGYEQPVDDSGEVLYDAGGVRIICKGLQESNLWDGELVFLLENNSGKDILISTEDVSVNGFMQSLVGLWSELRDGTRLIDSMSLMSLDDLEIESIDEVKNIEFAVEILESKTWNEIATTDTISLNFE